MPFQPLYLGIENHIYYVSVLLWFGLSTTRLLVAVYKCWMTISIMQLKIFFKYCFYRQALVLWMVACSKCWLWGILFQGFHHRGSRSSYPYENLNKEENFSGSPWIISALNRPHSIEVTQRLYRLMVIDSMNETAASHISRTTRLACSICIKLTD